MVDGYTLRRATLADAATICQQRRAMFVDMGQTDAARLDQMEAGFLIWLHERLADDTYLGLFAVDAAGQIAAGAAAWLMDWAPTYNYPKRTRGYLLNVYTEPAHRRRGLARWLVQAVAEECRARGVTLLLLHASQAGRPLYAGIGYRDSNEMRLFLEDSP